MKELEQSKQGLAWQKGHSSRDTEVAKLEAEIAALRARCEQTDVQLAGCATAAQGWAKEPPQPGDYGWSASFQEVLNLRQKWESACEHERLAVAAALRDQLKRLRKIANDWEDPELSELCDEQEALISPADAKELDAHDAALWNEALEEAAGYAASNGGTEEYRTLRDGIAAGIRALKREKRGRERAKAK